MVRKCQIIILKFVGETEKVLSGVESWSYKCSYKGQVDDKNQPCGHGEAINHTTGLKFSSSWLDGKQHGLGK